MFTCTWLLVMSGTASIGSRYRAVPPITAAMRVSSRTSQRLRTAQLTMGAIIGSVLVPCFALAELGLEREAVLRREGLAAIEALRDGDEGHPAGPMSPA